MDAGDALVEVLRKEGPRVLATLVRDLGDLSVAEDALSEATISALGDWPGSGIPENPRAWLTVVARRKALDLKTLNAMISILKAVDSIKEAQNDAVSISVVSAQEKNGELMDATELLESLQQGDSIDPG